MSDVPPPPPPGSDRQYAGTDLHNPGYNTPAAGDTTDHPFHGLFGRIKHGVSSAVTTVSDKAHDIANDPNVHKTVQGGAHVATNIGVGVFNGVKQDGVGMATDVKTGNYGHALLRAAPLLVGGPAGLVVKEVAPHVIGESIKQLPPGARASVEASGVGRVMIGAAEHGRIPTSPIGFASIAMESAKHTAIDATVRTATGGRIGTGQEAQGGYPYQQSGAYGRSEYPATAANQGEYGNTLNGRLLTSLPIKHFLPGVVAHTVARTVITAHTDGAPAVAANIGLPGGIGARVNLNPNVGVRDQIVPQGTRVNAAVQVNTGNDMISHLPRVPNAAARAQVNYNQVIASREAGAVQYPAAPVTRVSAPVNREMAAAQPQAPAATARPSNQVFPSWMKPATPH